VSARDGLGGSGRGRVGLRSDGKSDAGSGRRLRVVVLGAEWFGQRPGGLNRYLAALVRGIATAVDVRSIVVGPAPEAPPEVEAVSHVDAPLWRRLLAVSGAAWRLGRGADIVDVHFALYAIVPLLVGGLRKAKVVVHFQGPWAAESAQAGAGRWACAAKQLVERTVYRRADAIVVLSAAFGDIVVREYGVDPTRVHVVAPGTDMTRFSPGERGAARRRVGAGEGTFVVVSTRRLERRMGLDVLLRAWRSVQEEVPDSLLLVAGAGSEEQHLRALAGAVPRPSTVRLLGRVSDQELVELYRAADCSVVPSRSLEGFGLVVPESLACGTPVIVTDVGGLPEAVRSLDDSLVVTAGDDSALASRLIAAQKGLLPDRQACRAYAEGFGWDEVTRWHLDLFQSMMTTESPAQAEVDLGNGPRRLRVAFVDHCAALSGGELALARLLGSLDVEAHVILGEEGPLRSRLEAGGVSVQVLPMARRLRHLRRERVGPAALLHAVTLCWYVVRLTGRLRRLRPDVVHTNSLKAALYGGVAGRLAGVPVVWHLRDRIAPDYLPPLGVRLVRAASRVLPSAVIANSSSTLATLFHTVAIPSPVDVRPTPRVAEDAGLRIGIVGRLAPWKGQDLFLRAFARAFPAGDVVAVIVGSAMFGEDDYALELKELIVELGLDGRVEMIGFCDDIEAVLATMDVVVHASTVPEPFGQVVAEAMGAGRPVVASDAGGPAEIIEHGVTGLLYPMGSEEGLAEALGRLAGDSALRERLGATAVAAAQRYRPDVVAAEVSRFYSTVLSQGVQQR